MKISLEHVNYVYNAGLSMEVQALKDIRLAIEKPEFIALIGSTGSGKSTLIQLLNGLLKPTDGLILFDGMDLYEKDGSAQDKTDLKTRKQVLKDLRRRVGLVFQYPENQLFGETVLEDASFGPVNLGFSKEEAGRKAESALQTVGISSELFEKSPFELSGGEMRRVAIAGVLAMEPELLILDEPTAGLDPQGKIEILESIRSRQKQTGMIVLFVSHNMEEVAEYADRVIAMHEGRIFFDGDVQTAFLQHEELEKIGLQAPEITYLCDALDIPGVFTLDEAARRILQIYR